MEASANHMQPGLSPHAALAQEHDQWWVQPWQVSGQQAPYAGLEAL